MVYLSQKQEQKAQKRIFSTRKTDYYQDKKSVLPTLINKEQLNTIITDKNSTPDYLAINIYFDTLRSWYNPKIGYTKDGNLYHINKLKTPGIYLNYARLAEIHGCSKETIRQKIVKLEHLGLVHRSFQHMESVTTKSYNRLIAYVWKDTPHFYNPMGIDSDQVPELIAQTNHEYIEKKYGRRFGSLASQNKGISIGGGIQACLDTKELNNVILKDIRSNVQAHESNFLQNSESVKLEENTEPQITEFPKEPAKPVKLKKRLSNERKKPTNAERKAKVYRFNQYKDPQDLGYHYPLTKEDGDKLQSLSGRDFSLNAMNEILLDMSKRLDNRFCSKAQFMAYFGKCLRYEMRDAVKTCNNHFRIKANITPINQKAIEKEKQIEQYLAEVEQNAITYVCPENQLKAKLANVLEPLRSYELLSKVKDFKLVGNTMRIYLSHVVVLRDHDQSVILSQVQSIYSTRELAIKSVEYIVDKSNVSVKPYNKTQPQEVVIKPILPQGIWGDICRQLIEGYGVHVYNNWFSKLTPFIDEKTKTIKLKAPTPFTCQWIDTNYGDVILKMAKSLGLEFEGISVKNKP